MGCRFIWLIAKSALKVNAVAHSKRTLPLLKLLDNFKINEYDLVVAHTLAALYPVFSISKNEKRKFAFDVEDFHPGEKIFSDAMNEKLRREKLLKRMLPFATYISGAAPLISDNIEKLVPGTKVITVLNYFPASEFVEPADLTSDKLKLVWFSQNINAGRGLELVLSVWKEVSILFELTLIGKIDTNFYKEWLEMYPSIVVVNPLTQEALHKDLSLFDIGLAIDVATDDFNRELAITNKILAYYQAGLYILATDTPAQRDFIERNDSHGMVTPQTPESLLAALKKMYSIKTELRGSRGQRFANASLSSWENESLVIKSEWEKIRQIK